MTKIKNTKKGMAKKTLSMSLVVAMLATSNVPVWAAEFSDGTDAAVETEAPAAETFSDDATPAVEDTTDAVAAEATTNGIGYDITASDFTGVTDNEIKWGDKTGTANVVSTTINVAGNENKTTGATLKYVWKDADGQIGNVTTFDEKTDENATITLSPELSNKQLSLFVYAEKDGNVVWSWTSDTFTVKPIDINDVITTADAPTLKTGGGTNEINLTYTGKSIVPTIDNFDFTTTTKNTGFTASDFVIGSTNGDTVNVTEKGVDVYLTVNKTGYTGSVVVNYGISPLTLTADNYADYVTPTFATESKAYTGKQIKLKKSAFKLVDKKTGVDLSAFVKDETVTVGTDANPTQAGTQFNTGKGDANLQFKIVQPSTGYYNYTIAKGTEIEVTPTNAFTVTKRNLNTVDITIPEQAYVDDNTVIAVDPTKVQGITYKDKTTGETLDLSKDIAIASTFSKQGTYDATVSPATGNKNVEGTTTAKLSIVASTLSSATFENSTYAVKPEEYTGSQVTKDITKLGSVKIGSTVLVKDEDYKIEFGENVNAGKGTIKIVGLKSYAGSVKTIEFTINPAVVSKDSISISEYVEKKDTTKAADYKDAMNLVVKAKNADGKEFTLTEGTDYVIDEYTFSDSTGAVNATVNAKLKTSAATSVTKTDTTTATYYYLKNKNFVVAQDSKAGTYSSTITKTTLKDVNIKLKKTSYTYTGAAIKPEFDVVVDGRIINPELYKVKSLTNNVNAGTATMVVTGTGTTYSDKVDASVTFTITAADASKLACVLPSEKYTGYSIQPDVTGKVTLDDVAINVKDNFTVTYGENVAMGEGTVILAPKNNNFTGTKTITFKITGQMLNGGALKYYDANGLAISKLSHKYDGIAYTPAKTVFNAATTTLNGKSATLKLTEGTDYEIKYVDNVYGKKNASGDQKGIVLVVAKGSYAGDYNLAGYVSKGIYTDAEGNKIENVIYADTIDITTLEIKNTNVSVANGVYAGGLPVKPVVVVNVGGKTLVEGTDYELKYGDSDDRTKVTTTKSLTVKIIGKNGYRTNDNTLSVNGIAWGIDKFNLANADVTVDGDKVTVKCGRVDVETSEYTVEQKDGKVTVTAKKDSKNYTGSKTVDTATQDQKPGTPMISSVKVVGNKATAILSGDTEGAAGYDYVISTDRDCITNKNYDSISKNQVQTSTTFKYVQQGTYYAYCHAWKRDENGKKVFSDWSNAYPFVVSAITPDAPVITSVKVSGSTIKVTYKAAANATGYDVVLGTSSKKENGETRPYNYGAHKVLNLKEGTVTATFKNVPKGTWTVGMHAFNRTSEDGKKVFSPWSNLKKATVK